MAGSAFGGWKSRDSIPRLVKKYMEKRIKLEEFVTCEFPLNQINHAFEVMQAGKCLRSVINF